MTCNADALETLLFNQRSAAQPGSFEHRLRNAGVESGVGFSHPPSSVPAWARAVRGGRGLLKGPRCQSLPITPASFTTLLPRSQPRPDPGEEGGIYPAPSRHSPLCKLTFDHPPSLRIKKKVDRLIPQQLDSLPVANVLAEHQTLSVLNDAALSSGHWPKH